MPCESCQAALDQEVMGDSLSDSEALETAEQMADETGYSRTTDQGPEFNPAWNMDPSQSSGVATQELPSEVWTSSGEYFSPPADAYPVSGLPAQGPMSTEVPGQPVYTQAPLNPPLPAPPVFSQPLPNQHFSTAPRYTEAVLPPNPTQSSVQRLPPPLAENPPQSLKWRAVSQYRETFPAPPAADVEIEDALPVTPPAILPEPGRGGEVDEFHPPVIIDRN